MTDGSRTLVYADDAKQAKESAEIMIANKTKKRRAVRAVRAELLTACGK